MSAVLARLVHAERFTHIIAAHADSPRPLGVRIADFALISHNRPIGHSRLWSAATAPTLDHGLVVPSSAWGVGCCIERQHPRRLGLHIGRCSRLKRAALNLAASLARPVVQGVVEGRFARAAAVAPPTSALSANSALPTAPCQASRRRHGAARPANGLLESPFHAYKTAGDGPFTRAITRCSFYVTCFYVRYYVLGLLRARNGRLKPFYACVIQLRNVLQGTIT